MRFLVVSAGWRTWPWIKQSLDSIAAQTWPHVDVVVADDASGDPELSEWITSYCKAHGWTSLLQPAHKGTLRNEVEAIRLMKPEPEDVIVFVDADGDMLADPEALARLAAAYEDGSQVVWSQYRPEPASPGSAPSCAYPPHVVAAGTYRVFTGAGGGHVWNHLRSFKASLFYEMDDSDFTYDDGTWFQGAPDSALMFPAIELARGRIKFLDDVLLIYRADHELSDWKRVPGEIDRAHDTILSRPPKAYP